MRLCPSRIKDGAHGYRDFHADLLFELSAWKFMVETALRRTLRRSIRIEQVQFGSEDGDKLGSA